MAIALLYRVELLGLFQVRRKICLEINQPFLRAIRVQAKRSWSFQFERGSVPLFICVGEIVYVGACRNLRTRPFMLLCSKLLALLVDAQLLEVVVQVYWSDSFILQKVIYSELDINIVEVGKARICSLLLDAS